MKDIVVLVLLAFMATTCHANIVQLTLEMRNEEGQITASYQLPDEGQFKRRKTVTKRKFEEDVKINYPIQDDFDIAMMEHIYLENQGMFPWKLISYDDVQKKECRYVEKYRTINFMIFKRGECYPTKKVYLKIKGMNNEQGKITVVLVVLDNAPFVPEKKVKKDPGHQEVVIEYVVPAYFDIQYVDEMTVLWDGKDKINPSEVTITDYDRKKECKYLQPEEYEEDEDLFFELRNPIEQCYTPGTKNIWNEDSDEE